MSHATGARILIVDDEPAIVRVLEANLRKHAFQVESATTGRGALDAYTRHPPDLLLLDLGLPDLDGMEVIQRLRTLGNTPIVVLSARQGESDKVHALELGADDYLTKPFGPRELLARVRVALRHAARPARGTDAIVQVGDLAVDFERRRVTRAGQEVHLTPTEYELVKVFVANQDRVLTDHQLLESIWGATNRQQAHSLRVYVARLRRLIEPDPRVPRYLVTEPGVGYRFVSEV